MSADSWKLTLPCTRDEAEAIDAADDLAIEAVIMTTEAVSYTHLTLPTIYSV